MNSAASLPILGTIWCMFKNLLNDTKRSSKALLLSILVFASCYSMSLIIAGSTSMVLQATYINQYSYVYIPAAYLISILISRSLLFRLCTEYCLTHSLTFQQTKVSKIKYTLYLLAFVISLYWIDWLNYLLTPLLWITTWNVSKPNIIVGYSMCQSKGVLKGLRWRMEWRWILISCIIGMLGTITSVGSFMVIPTIISKLFKIPSNQYINLFFPVILLSKILVLGIISGRFSFILWQKFYLPSHEIESSDTKVSNNCSESMSTTT